MNKILKEAKKEFAESKHDSLQEFLLINGQFTAEEAKEILTCLISSKLSFHNKKNLRSIEHTGQIDHKAKKRIKELEKMRLEILKLVEKGEESGFTLNIYSDINIKLVQGSN